MILDHYSQKEHLIVENRVLIPRTGLQASVPRNVLINCQIACGQCHLDPCSKLTKDIQWAIAMVAYQ